MRRKIALFVLLLILVALIAGAVVLLLSRQAEQPPPPAETETPAVPAASITPPALTATPTVVAAAPTDTDMVDTAIPTAEANTEVPAMPTDTDVPPTATATFTPAISPTPSDTPLPPATSTHTPWPTFTRSPTPRSVVPALTLTVSPFPTFTPTFTRTATPIPPPSSTPVAFVFTPWPTFTRSPTPRPVTPTLTYTPQPATFTPIPPAATEVADARVKLGVTGLNLRDKPGLGGNVVGFLTENTPMTVIGRTVSNDWVQVIAFDGQSGWVAISYVDVNINLGAVGVTGEVVAIVPTSTPIPFVPTFTPIPVQPTATFTSIPVVPSSPYVSGIGSRAREIYAIGQQKGNRANVFSKVGDSLTVATYVLYPIGWGMGNLQDYGYLSGTVNYFLTTTARDSNSFANASLAADNGWTTANVLDPNKANSGICQAGETPLECEYRVVRPSIAIIQLGTNDIAAMSGSEYNTNLRTIVDKTIARGIVPVLFTIPDRLGFSGQANEFNNIIINTANSYGIPLVDYGQSIRSLPNGGLSGDGVHPSWPPGHFSESTNLTAANLQYGYTMRNLVILQALDALWRQVIS